MEITVLCVIITSLASRGLFKNNSFVALHEYRYHGEIYLQSGDIVTD